MKKIELKIETCDECLHVEYIYRGRGIASWCLATDRELPETGSIPEWCPLENVDNNELR